MRQKIQEEIPVKEYEKGFWSLDEIIELRIILYRLVCFLQGDWKVWLPYDNETGIGLIEKLAEKTKAIENMWEK